MAVRKRNDLVVRGLSSIHEVKNLNLIATDVPKKKRKRTYNPSLFINTLNIIQVNIWMKFEEMWVLYCTNKF